MTTAKKEESEQRLTLTVPQAGALLGCGKNKSYALAKAGVIPTIRLGSRLVVPKKKFLTWLNGQQEEQGNA